MSSVKWSDYAAAEIKGRFQDDRGEAETQSAGYFARGGPPNLAQPGHVADPTAVDETSSADCSLTGP
jgi:hypothetical protein